MISLAPVDLSLNNGVPDPGAGAPSLDFETRSVVDLKSAGVQRYAEDPSTRVLCAAVKLGDAERIWVPGMPMPDVLAAAIARGEQIQAWNASFEIAIWRTVMVRLHAWPDLPASRFTCTMQRAAIVGCPGALERAVVALGLPVVKDMDGHRLMLRMCKPLPTRKNDPAPEIKWHDDPEDHMRLQRYCMGDVRAESMAAQVLPAPPPMEAMVMRVDRFINTRGVTIDIEAAQGAARIAQTARSRLNGEIRQITNGRVKTTDQVAAILTVLRERGVDMDRLRAADVRDILEDTNEDASSSELDVDAAQIALYGDMDPVARRVLELRAEASKASTAKLRALVNGVLADGRMVDLFAYAAAYRTARWAGRRFQAHNLPRVNPPCETEDEIERWYDALASGDHDRFAELLPSDMTVMDGLKASLRGFITASPGNVLCVADLAQIEARGGAWMAGQWDLVHAFERLDAAVKQGAPKDVIAQLDIYTVQGRKMQSDRQGGKIGTLGCQYGAAENAIAAFAAGYGLKWDTAIARVIVDAWRAANPMIVQAWTREETTAKQALANPNQVFVVGDGRSGAYCFQGGNLLRKLPSGRVLVYRKMRIEPMPTPWGQMRQTLTYEGNIFAKGRPGEFVRLKTYAGKLFQNTVQAFCRDILAAGLIRGFRAGLPTVLHVHDEQGIDSPRSMVAEHAPLLVRAMTDPIQWVEGLPIASSADVSFRYRKN